MLYILEPVGKDIAAGLGPIGIVIFSALPGVGLCVATYGFHRNTSSFLLSEEQELIVGGEDSEDGVIHRKRIWYLSLLIHGALTALFTALSVAVLTVLVLECIKCSRENCVGNVILSSISLVVSLSWVGVTYLGYMDLKTILASIEEQEMAKDEEQQMELEGERWLEVERRK